MDTEEYYTLKAKARDTGINRSEFIRLCIRSSVVKQRLTSELMAYIRQLCGMANNVNQVAPGKCCRVFRCTQAMPFYERAVGQCNQKD